MRKRILSCILTVCMMLTLLPVTAFAADATLPADLTGVTISFAADSTDVTTVTGSLSKADSDSSYTLALGGYLNPGENPTAETTKALTATLSYGADADKTELSGEITLTYKAAEGEVAASWTLPANAVTFTNGAETDPATIDITIAGAVATEATTYAVSGSVSKGDTQVSDLSGITVSLYAASDTDFETALGTGTTDANGAYTIDNEVADGSYVVVVAASIGNYALSKSDVTVNGAAVTNADITLQGEDTPPATTYTVSGSVAAGKTGVTELTGITVTLYKLNDGTRGDSAGSAVTTEDGVFSIADVADGSYEAVVAAVSGSHAESSAQVTVDGANVTDVEITLQGEDTSPASTYTVSGSVAAGKTDVTDLTGITVTLYKLNDGTRGDSAGSAVTTEDGAFSIADVADGSYEAVVAAVSGSYAESSAQVTVDGANATDVEITLQEDVPAPTYAVSGTVSEGTASVDDLSGITVSLYAASDTDFETAFGTGTTDANGAYTIDKEVVNGSYVVVVAASAGNYALSKANVTVNGAAVTDANITLLGEGEQPNLPVDITSIAVSLAPNGLKVGDSLPTSATVTTVPAEAVTVDSIIWTKDGETVETPATVSAGTYTVAIKLTITDTGKHQLGADVTCKIDDETAAIAEETLTLTKEFTVTADVQKFNVSVTATPNVGGTAEADKVQAATGETVTVTIHPVEGYHVAMITLDDTVVDDADGDTYTFTMPNAPVIVAVTFEKDGIVHPTVEAPAASNGSASVSEDLVNKAIEAAVNDSDHVSDVADATLGTVTISAADASSIALDQKAVETLAEAASVKIVAEAGTVTLPQEILTDNSSKPLTLVVEETTAPEVAADVEIAASYEVKIESNGTEIAVKNLEAPIQLHFEIDTGLSESTTLAYYDPAAKTIKAIASSDYDSQTGVIEGTVNHLTQFVVTDEQNVSDDTTEDPDPEGLVYKVEKLVDTTLMTYKITVAGFDAGSACTIQVMPADDSGLPVIGPVFYTTANDKGVVSFGAPTDARVRVWEGTITNSTESTNAEKKTGTIIVNKTAADDTANNNVSGN